MVVSDLERDHRPPALDADAVHQNRRRRVVDLERRARQLARERHAERVGRRVGGDDLHEVRAVGDRRRVPHQNRLRDAAPQRRPRRLALAAIQHVVGEVVVVLVVRLPDERLEPFLIRAAAQRRRA